MSDLWERSSLDEKEQYRILYDQKATSTQFPHKLSDAKRKRRAAKASLERKRNRAGESDVTVSRRDMICSAWLNKLRGDAFIDTIFSWDDMCGIRHIVVGPEAAQAAEEGVEHVLVDHVLLAAYRQRQQQEMHLVKTLDCAACSAHPPNHQMSCYDAPRTSDMPTQHSSDTPFALPLSCYCPLVSTPTEVDPFLEPFLPDIPFTASVSAPSFLEALFASLEGLPQQNPNCSAFNPEVELISLEATIKPFSTNYGAVSSSVGESFPVGVSLDSLPDDTVLEKNFKQITMLPMLPTHTEGYDEALNVFNLDSNLLGFGLDDF
ncbi:hypothetical protein BKA62DRAFT_776385 [Auriculariales sp. MPI-PUGE-AT-0066]|nr:hypothetical protein BKA62DRAFT_776385 [Auriculariales sp. MPI-PUGE-AT-0066]